MLNPEQIAQFLTGKVTHARYEQATAIRKEMLVHTRGATPSEILNTARPNEEQVHKDYRLSVFEPITKAAAGKVITQVAKIRRSQGFGLTFPKQQPARIKDGQGLREYMEQDFPVFDTLMDCVFQTIVRACFEDPNGVILVFPKEYETEETAAKITDTDYLKPYPFYFNSGEVLDFQEGEYVVILKDEKVSYQHKGKTETDGNLMLIADNVNYYFYKQTGKDKDDHPTYQTRTYAHNLPSLPAWQLGSNDIESQYPGYNLYNSFLSPCLPNWRQAIRSFSDHQVNQVMHIHPEKWYKTTTECKTCNNKGKVQTKIAGGKTEMHECQSCKGAGFIIKVSPMAPIIMSPYQSKVGEQPQFFDGDPAGYIAKPTNDMEFIKAEYKDQIAQGLAAIGLDYIEQTQLNQSGKAKELDRQEINTFFYGVASQLAKPHIYNILYYTNELRYGFVDPKQRDDYFKAITISVPEQFDVVGSDYYYQQYINAQSNKDDAELVAAKAMEYARVEFGEDSQQFKMMQARYLLDPLPGMNVQEKLDYRASGECTAEDLVISQQLYAFLKRAVAENDEFLELEYAEQMDKLNEYAEEKLNKSVSRRLEQPPMFTTKNAS